MSLEVTDITPLGVLDPVGRAVLVVIDVLGHEVANPYAGEKGPMAGRESRNAAIAALTDSCRQKNVPVVFIQEQHKPEGTDIGRELDGAEGMYCIEGSPDSQLYPGLNPTADEYVIVKRRYSAFFGTPAGNHPQGISRANRVASR
jgi:nicotinamidase-related amidase